MVETRISTNLNVLCRIILFLLLSICSSAHSEDLPQVSDTDPVSTTYDVKPEYTPTSTGATDSKEKDTSKLDSISAMGLASSGSATSSNPIYQFTVTNSTFTGAVATSIPITVPPGRNGMAPKLALVYFSQKGNGWLGVGWDLDMGAIQRSTKFGVNYNANNFVAVANGSSSELVPRGDWGVNYYGAKIEGAFLKHYYNATTGGWEVELTPLYRTLG